MVHINSKYVDAEGNLDGGYATNADGLDVLGFMFEVNSTVSFSLIMSPDILKMYEWIVEYFYQLLLNFTFHFL